MSKVVVMATDDGTVTWQAVSKSSPTGQGHDSSDIYAGGWLFGPQELTNRVKSMLDPESDIAEVDVTWSRYTFTPDRSTPADVVAAMYASGMGRGLLNENGWDILHIAMPELIAPENNRTDVIY